MNWADSAVLAAAALAAVNVIDSHLITRRFPGLRAFLLSAGLFAIAYGIAVLLVFPLPGDAGTTAILIAIASGIIRAAGILLFLYVMRTQEVSRVIPVVNIHPVLVAVMAVPLLGETLVAVEWIAILMTVAGAILISRRSNLSPSRSRLSLLMVLPFVSAVCMAGANLTSKYALDHISFWNMYAIGSLALGCACLIVACRPLVVRQLVNVNRPRSTFAILAFNETLAPVAAILLFWSIERGPVSLVSAIAGAQPVFVFFFAVIASRLSSGVLLERRMSRAVLATRSFAIAMIVGGITIIHLV